MRVLLNGDVAVGLFWDRYIKRFVPNSSLRLRVFSRQGKYADAEQLYEQVLAVEVAADTSDQRMAKTFMNWALVLQLQASLYDSLWPRERSGNTTRDTWS